MTTVILRCRVADYDAWRPGYDRAVDGDPYIRSYRVWRGQDDRNLIVAAETFDSREAAEAAYATPGLQELMEQDGVDLSSLQVEFFDDAGSWTR